MNPLLNLIIEKEWYSQSLFCFLSFYEISIFDGSITNSKIRYQWLQSRKRLQNKTVRLKSDQELLWIKQHNIYASAIILGHLSETEFPNHDINNNNSSNNDKVISDDGCSYLFNYCDFLENLQIYNCHHITNLGYSKLLPQCKFLTSIKLYNCVHLTNDNLEQIGECTFYDDYIRIKNNLILIDIYWCNLISYTGLSYLLTNSPKLEYFKFNCHNVSCNDYFKLHILFENCPKLKTVLMENFKLLFQPTTNGPSGILSDRFGLGNNSINNNNSNNILALYNSSNHSSRSNSTKKNYASNNNNNINVSSSSSQSISKSISSGNGLDNNGLSHNGLSHNGLLKNMLSIELEVIHGLTDELLMYIGQKCPLLHTLSLREYENDSNNRHNNEVSSIFSNNSNNSNSNISGSGYYNNNNQKLGLEFLLINCSFLIVLEINTTSITISDQSFYNLSMNCPCIETFILCNSYKITDLTMIELSKLKYLKIINIDGLSLITDEGIFRLLETYQNLEKMTFTIDSHQHITEHSIYEISRKCYSTLKCINIDDYDELVSIECIENLVRSCVHLTHVGGYISALTYDLKNILDLRNTNYSLDNSIH